jgi:hypothetical protein
LVETLFAHFQNPASGRRLYAVTEPLAPTADGMRVAAEAISALGETFQHAQGTLSTALRAACDSAHERVREANQPDGPRSLDDRIYVGLTAVAVEHDAMLIAQAPPGQALVVQDRQLYAVPSLDSWRPDFNAGAEDEASRPLGVGPHPALRISSTNASPSDHVVLCSSGLGACLSRGLDKEQTAPAALVPALTGNPTELAADLDELAEALGEGRCLAACVYQLDSDTHWIWTADRAVTTGRSPLESSATDVVARNTREKGLAEVRVHSGQSDAQPEQDAPSGSVDARTIDPEPASSGERVPDPDRPRGFGRSTETMDRVQIVCVAAFERLVGGLSARLRRGDRRSSFSAPGARTMHLYRGSFTGPIAPSIRAHLPRGPRVHLPVRLLSVLATAILLVAIAGFLYDRDRDRDARAETYLARADAQLRTVATANDGSDLTAALGNAQSAIDEARDNGANDQLLASRQAVVDEARDAMRGIDRLENVTRLGTLPTVDEGVARRLIINGPDVYLLAGGLYHVDAQSRALTLLLERGMRIDRATVHELRDVTVDNGVLTATDGLALYRLEADGSWDRQRIGRVDDKTPWTPTASAAFEGSYYLLDGDNGQILKFPAENLTSLPDDWAGANERDELSGALDMVIDGRIYVLLDDGTIQSYYRGSADGTLSIEVDPGLKNPAALFGGGANAYLYVADGGSGGRITRVDRNGEDVRQYLLPTDSPDGTAVAFAAIEDFVVNEAVGIIYVLSGNQLWSATVPSPDSVAQAG